MKHYSTSRISSYGLIRPASRWLPLACSLALVSGVATLPSWAQQSLPPVSKVTPDTTKPGFKWRVFANQADQVNSTAKTEAALTGQLKDADGNPLPNLADPAAQGVALAPANPASPENAPIEFEIEGVINLNKDGGGGNGNFTPDDQMPGVPATDGSNNGVAAEIITYLELPAGTITMGVNSDDGFRTSSGDLRDAFRARVLGEFSGGRGAGDTIFTFNVTEAGVYPFRTTWEQGGGDANVEWFTVQSNGDKVLVGDTANGGVKAYRAALSVAAQAPYVKSVTPGPGLRQLNQVSSSVVLVLNDGDTVAIDDSSIVFKVDGVTVTDKKREGKTITLTYTPTGIQFPGESHTATLTFGGAGGFTRTETWGFKNLKNVVLPTPVVTENFDSYAEGTQPTGWVATNFTTECDPGEDITSQRSDTYKNWVVISTDTIPSIDDAGINEVNASEKLNGQPLTLEMLRSGNVLYAESDSRCNGDRASVLDGTSTDPAGQTQFIVTKPYNLSAVKNPVLSFGSGYMQNQDSYGGVEYSVDGGNSWLPVVYFLDVADIIVAADGSTDGVATLTKKQTDTSLWVVGGVVKGEAYGDALAAPINADIGNYIAPRVNDDGKEGKRIEIFRLPAAANKADVRLRLSATGTDSWYFFVDNIAFYDVPTTTVPTVTVISSSTLNGAYTPDASATKVGDNSFTVPIGDGAKYFRLDGATSIKSVGQEGNNLILTY